MRFPHERVWIMLRWHMTIKPVSNIIRFNSDDILQIFIKALRKNLFLLVKVDVKQQGNNCSQTQVGNYSQFENVSQENNYKEKAKSPHAYTCEVIIYTANWINVLQRKTVLWRTVLWSPEESMFYSVSGTGSASDSAVMSLAAETCCCCNGCVPGVMAAGWRETSWTWTCSPCLSCTQYRRPRFLLNASHFIPLLKWLKWAGFGPNELTGNALLCWRMDDFICSGLWDTPQRQCAKKAKTRTLASTCSDRE